MKPSACIRAVSSAVLRFHRFRIAAALLVPGALLCAGPASAQSGIVRVRFETSAGNIVLALETKRAPKTAGNFLAYVDDRRFDNTRFYRSSRAKLAPTYGFIQGGIMTDAKRILPPFPFESTAKTGVKHLDGTISMARRADPKSSGGNYFITVGAAPQMDAGPGTLGYAAFGRVTSGMDVVRRILAMPTGGGMGGQMLRQPVRIFSVRRIDGSARPTGRVKPWLVKSRPGS